MLDTRSLNPHRIQIYSIEEIWKAMLERLIHLEVLRDPDENIAEDSDSDDLEDDFDYIEKVEPKIPKMFSKKRYVKDKIKPIA
jgi:hypothetical protein